MNIFDHDDCLARCRTLKAANPEIFAAYDEQCRTGGFYPDKGTKARAIIDEYERLSARAGRYAAG